MQMKPLVVQLSCAVKKWPHLLLMSGVQFVHKVAEQGLRGRKHFSDIFFMVLCRFSP